MTTFSPTDAALEGFRLVRERLRVVGVWALVYLAYTVVSTFLLISYAGETLTALRAAEETGGPEPEMMLGFLAQIAPFSLIGLVFATVFLAAVYRVILRPEDRSYAYLRLGADELRLVALAFIFLALWMAALFLLLIVVGIVGAAGAAAGGGGAATSVVAVVGALASLLLIPAVIWLWVRLSLAWPMTFAERRIRIFESWRLTKGHFWRLFGAYLLAIILAILVWMLGLILYAGVAAILTGGDVAAVGQVFNPQMDTPGAYFTPAMIIYMVFAGLLGPLQYLILFAPGAVAYRDLAGAGEG